ncbi:hypothetical protein [Paraoerskovia marina]|uniref:hypothetical protein n=1 Tax=Paraoerskovia marina TaxID=545619 RepID=UPI0004924232|nr:hypothetical protein [Paraoerskovia marina]
MDTRFWLEVIGWTGSVLVVLSLMQARVLRFRWMNFAGAFIATIYNGVIEVWPFAAMNGAITLIDIYWLRRLYRERHDENTYAVVPVADDDAYLAHVLEVHAADVATERPDFEPGRRDDRAAFLVVRGDETVGVVIVRDGDPGEGVIDLDWVSPRFRDFTPGEFVHRTSGIFADRGYTRVVVPRTPTEDPAYLERVGFTHDGDRWVREVAVG